MANKPFNTVNKNADHSKAKRLAGGVGGAVLMTAGSALANDPRSEIKDIFGGGSTIDRFNVRTTNNIMKATKAVNPHLHYLKYKLKKATTAEETAHANPDISMHDWYKAVSNRVDASNRYFRAENHHEDKVLGLGVPMVAAGAAMTALAASPSIVKAINAHKAKKLAMKLQNHSEDFNSVDNLANKAKGIEKRRWEEFEDVTKNKDWEHAHERMSNAAKGLNATNNKLNDKLKLRNIIQQSKEFRGKSKAQAILDKTTFNNPKNKRIAEIAISHGRVFNEDNDFSIASNVEQRAIGLIPVYGKYNKYKKVKALSKLGRYSDIGNKAAEYEHGKVGDDWGDLKIAVKEYFTNKYEDSGLAKAKTNMLIKHVYKNTLTDSDREILKELGFMK